MTRDLPQDSVLSEICLCSRRRQPEQAGRRGGQRGCRAARFQATRIL